MGSNKKRQQTISKRNRERAIEEKRTLKRERKQAAAAERAAIRDGTWVPPPQPEGELEGEDGIEQPAGEPVDAAPGERSNGGDPSAEQPVEATPPDRE